MSPDQIKSYYVRQIPGISNSGNFNVVVEEQSDNYRGQFSPKLSPKYSPKRSWIIPALVAFALVGVLAFGVGFLLAGCSIKGNISNTGERIYHIPGQDYYFVTRINWFAGERWFCSEEAARAAGWRKSRR